MSLLDDLFFSVSPAKSSIPEFVYYDADRDPVTGLISRSSRHSLEDSPPHSPRTSNSASGASGFATTHSYTRVTADKHPWLTLRVFSAAPSPKNIPVFVEGDIINGEVELDLTKPDNIKEITISVQGSMSSGHEEEIFMTLSETLWKSSTSNTSTTGRYRKKLEGVCAWPFSIALPGEFTLSSKRANKLGLSRTERLPPNLGGRNWNASISYQLFVEVKRGGALRAGSTLSTSFAYAPYSKPEVPSALRQQAYAEKTRLLGPELDPSGWSVYPNREVRGVLFKSREVTITCTFALAKPLTYTRGTVIPCILVIKTFDSQALDLLSKPSAPRVIFRCNFKRKPWITGTVRAGANRHQLEEEDVSIGSAMWAPPQETPRAVESYQRTLHGEIHLSSRLTPTFQFGGFNLTYCIDVFPFHVPGFTPQSEERLLRVNVAVASVPADGPRPRTLFPPGYSNLNSPGIISKTRRLLPVILQAQDNSSSSSHDGLNEEPHFLLG